ncbi:Hint domain-containing protein [Tropicibacter sp. S64]|uniref:Hint domain-containing protein n=1 Tax=Tropicibacter sp. S64 TaxID=3415122 RepID=UPI003C799EDD
MATYVLTTANWNSFAFWSGISSSGTHTLDFSSLPSTWRVTIDAEVGKIGIWNGSSWFNVGELGDFGVNLTLPFGASISQFHNTIGNAGNDYIEGTLSNDSFIGNAGNDTLSGDAGLDTISGGLGNDTLVGGQAADSLIGGDGNDQLWGDNMWFSPSDIASGIGILPTTLTVTNAADGPIDLYKVNLFGNLVYDRTLAAGQTVNIGTFTETNWVITDPSFYYQQVIYGGLGQTITFGGTSLGDTLDGGVGDDTIYGEYGNDNILGGTGNDVLYGGYGSDTIAGGTGNDQMFGNDDADRFVIADGFGIDTITGGEGLVLGIDDDRIDFSGLTSAVSVTYSGTEAALAVNGGNSLIFTQVEGLILTAYDDFVDANAGTFQLADLYIDAGAGNDSIAGSMADAFSDTILGGDGNDTIRGWSGDDSLLGGTGNDLLEGDAGADYVDGGTGDDTLTSWNGAATLVGGDGSDQFYVFDGTTTLGGGASFDSVTVTGGEGGTDNDLLSLEFFGAGASVTFGGDEAGTVTTGPEALTFTGIEALNLTDHADTLDASADNSGIYADGKAGDDTLRGGTGNDSLLGGADADTFIVTTGFGADTIVGGEDGTDRDRIDFSGLSVGITALYSGDEAGTVSDGTHTLGFSELEEMTLTAQGDYVDATVSGAAKSIDMGAGNDTFFGGTGGDTIAGGDGNDYIDGGAGDDFLTTGLGQDTLVGGTGNDTLMNSAGDDLLIGGDGDDSIVATQGYDTLDGGAGNDTLDGGSEDDLLIGGTGNDSMLGGDDADTFLIEDDFGADTIIGGEGVTSTSDNDLVDFSAVTGGVTVTYSGTEAGSATDGTDTLGFTEIERLVLTDQADSVDGTADGAGLEIDALGGNDTIVGGSAGDSIDGGSGNDSFEGRGGNDTIIGGDGDDFIDDEVGFLDGSGNDFFDGGAGNDTIYGGNDNDTLIGGSGNDLIAGEEGDDNLSGGLGDDTLWGDEGNDTITGDAGNDRIIGWIGADSLSGGDAADVFVIQSGFGNDTIVGGETSITGIDSDTIDLTANGVAVTVDYDGSEFGTVTDGADTISFSEIERFLLTDYNDFLTAGADGAGVYAEGGLGNDTLWGGTGADTFIGGDGADNIYGDAGNDSISGGIGNDDLGGDAGNDTVSGGDGNDWVEGANGDDVLYGDAGQDTLRGGSGQDTLTGGTGNDLLTGGTGNDTFVYTPGDGADTITDFNTGNTGTLSDGDSTNNDFIDLSAYYDDIWELQADQADDGILNQSNTTTQTGKTVDYSDNTQFAPGDSLTFTGATADANFYTVENTGVVCFTKGTLIRTPRGEVPIERLRVGDLVVTRDNGPQPLIWTGRRHVGRGKLIRMPKLLPVRIAPGLVGASRPLLVSPQHGMVLRVDGEERLVRATHLARMAGGQARVARGCRGVTYMHLMFETHQIVFANGAASESFYPGPQAMAALDTASRGAVLDLFPDLREHGAAQSFGATARDVVPASDLAERLCALKTAL